MKVHIYYKYTEGPWGGGNQFLKALRKCFERMGCYSDDAGAADIVLFNSHHMIDEIIELKRRKPELTLIHRIDGPISKIRNRDLHLDKSLFAVNARIVDGTIFQSMWSKKENYSLGFNRNECCAVITNAPDPSFFNRSDKASLNSGSKVKLISTSWSSNWRKGFECYQWLDGNLDFDRYDMTFIGNAPIKFNNIRYIEPMKPHDLAAELKKNHIFITASQRDPASNSLLEALHCGLPAIGFRDGGHPEIIDAGGELFTVAEEIPELLQKIENNYEQYQNNIRNPSIDRVGRQYYEFMTTVHENRNNNIKNADRFGAIDYFILKMKVFYLNNIGRVIN